MSNTIIELKHSQTPGNEPSSLSNGEISINTADGKFYYKDPSGVIQPFEKFPGPSGLDGEIQFNDSGDLGANAGLTFDKTEGVLNSNAIKTNSYLEFDDGSKQYTANAGGGSVNSFSVIAVSGEDNVVALGESTLNFVANGELSITTDASSNTITFTTTIEKTLKIYRRSGTPISINVASGTGTVEGRSGPIEISFVL